MNPAGNVMKEMQEAELSRITAGAGEARIQEEFFVHLQRNVIMVQHLSFAVQKADAVMLV